MISIFIVWYFQKNMKYIHVHVYYDGIKNANNTTYKSKLNVVKIKMFSHCSIPMLYLVDRILQWSCTSRYMYLPGPATFRPSFPNYIINLLVFLTYCRPVVSWTIHVCYCGLARQNGGSSYLIIEWQNDMIVQSQAIWPMTHTLFVASLVFVLLLLLDG